MIVEMNLIEPYFESLKYGYKDIEIRLLDEKRKKISVGDTIIFKCNCHEITTEVVNLSIYTTFEKLVDDVEINRTGNFLSKDDLLKTLNTIYSEEKRNKYNAIAIKVKNISN